MTTPPSAGPAARPTLKPTPLAAVAPSKSPWAREAASSPPLGVVKAYAVLIDVSEPKLVKRDRERRAAVAARQFLRKPDRVLCVKFSKRRPWAGLGGLARRRKAARKRHLVLRRC